MATTSHIRLSCIASQSSAYASVAEVEVSALASGANLCVGGTASGTNNYYSPTLAFNGVQTGSSTTAWAGTLPATLQYSFSAPVNIDFLRIYDPDTNDGQALKDFDIQVSDDGTTWFTARQIRNKVYSSTPTEYKLFISSANLSCPIQTISASGSRTSERGNINLVAPVGTFSAFGGANFVPMRAPQFSLAAFGGANAALTGTFPTLSANGHDSTGENDFAGAAPMASLAFAGGASARLIAPRPVLSVSATFTGFGKANLKAPKGTLQASGTTSGVASARLRAPMGKLVGYSGAVCSLTTKDSPTLVASGTARGIGSAALQAPMATLVGYSGAVCSITLTGGATLQASGTAGSVGRAQLTCPLFELTASGTVNGLSSANLIAPSPRLIGTSSVAYLVAPGAVLTAIGTAVVSVAYEAYSVNLKHKVRMQGDQPAVDEVTRYTNFPFTHIVRYQNSYFGVAADGLYLLEGTTDNGAPIAYAVKTAVDDFNVSNKKILSSAYLSGRIGPTMTVTLHAGETGQNAYSYSTPRGAGAQNHREKFGKGVKDRYFALGVSGVDLLEIDSVELEINTLNRKI